MWNWLMDSFRMYDAIGGYILGLAFSALYIYSEIRSMRRSVSPLENRD